MSGLKPKPDPHVAVWPDNTWLTYDPATQVLGLTKCTENPIEESLLSIKVTLTEEIRLKLIAVLCGDVVSEPTKDEVSAQEDVTGRDEDAFLVATKKLPLGSDFVARERSTVHQRTCKDAPRYARPVTDRGVINLVAMHGGNVMHQVEFCHDCFRTPDKHKDEHGNPLDVDGVPSPLYGNVTNTAELRELLSKYAQEHVSSVRAARRAREERQQGYRGQDVLEDALDNVVTRSDEYEARRGRHRDESAFDADEFDVADEMNPDREETIAHLREAAERQGV